MRQAPIELSTGSAAAVSSVLDPEPEATLEFFADRTHAGALLVERLRPLISSPCVVAAVPRGGVAVALPIVEQLHLPLAVVYATKLTVPMAPELALGALDEDGEMILDRTITAALNLEGGDIERTRVQVAAEIKRRMALYRVPPIAHDLPGAAVVLVDDGLATGLTMAAALAYARRHGAREVTIAVPCASLAAARRPARRGSLRERRGRSGFRRRGHLLCRLLPSARRCRSGAAGAGQACCLGAGAGRRPQGSVSERVPHAVPCSVLIVKGDYALNLASPAPSLSVWELNYLLARLTVGEVMTKSVIIIDPDRDPREAAAVMLDHKVGALPVLEGRRLVGILTETDLVRAFAQGAVTTERATVAR